MKKKILVVTTRPLESNVSSSIRKISTIKSLINNGAEVTVLSAEVPNDSPHFNNDVPIAVKTISIKSGLLYNFGITKTAEANTKTNLIKKMKVIARNIYYRFKIYDPLKSCIKHLNTISGELDSNYHIVISMSDPKSSHLLAINLLKKGIISCDEYIQIWGDPMYLDITNKFSLPKYFLKMEERRLIKIPDKVFYVSPVTMVEEKKLFPQYSHKMDVLFPTYEKEMIYEPVTKIKKIGYFGDFNSNIRDISPLYNAIKNSDYELIICGNSNLDLNSKSNININKRVSFEKVKELEKEVDLLVHISNNSGTQIPGKIYQYMGTNKPILYILDGQKDLFINVFSSYNRVMFCNNNIDDILETIQKFNKGEIVKKLEPIENFNSKSCAIKILESI